MRNAGRVRRPVRKRASVPSATQATEDRRVGTFMPRNMSCGACGKGGDVEARDVKAAARRRQRTGRRTGGAQLAIKTSGHRLETRPALLDARRS